MAYKILTQNSTDNTNIDGARAEHFNAGMRNGIVKGAFNEGNFSALSSNVIMLDTCELRISGHRVVIDEAWTHAFSSKPKTPQRYAVVGQVTVSEDTNVTFDLIVQLTDVNLVKNNLFRQTNGAGIYQEEIGRFTLNTDGSVIDVTRTIDIITGSKGEDLDGTINIGVVKTNTLEPEMDAEADVEQRYDAEQGKVLTDFTFSIPRGKGLEDLDTELSESSTNAVQNNVITSAINKKADAVELKNKLDIKAGNNVVYINDSSGTQATLQYSQESSAGNSIVQRKENGSISVPTPTVNEDAVPKNYVDDHLTTRTVLWEGNTAVSNVTITDIRNFKYVILYAKFADEWISVIYDTIFLAGEIASPYPTQIVVQNNTPDSYRYGNIFFNSHTSINTQLSNAGYMYFVGIK